MRTLVIGDIHGCYTELLELLDKAALSEDDHIIAIGDLVNRGPQNKEVLDFFRDPEKPNRQSIMGNHEHKHLRAVRGEIMPILSTLVTRWQVGDDYSAVLNYMESMPLYLDLPDALLVHGYYESGVSVEQQQDRVLLGTMGARGFLEDRFDDIWYKQYDGNKPLICGHKDWSGEQKPFNYKDRVFGLDTGCVYGGQLTGLILPDFEFVTTPAREAHWLVMLAQYNELE